MGGCGRRHILDMFYLKNASLPRGFAIDNVWHCSGTEINWCGNIYNSKQLVVDYSKCKWPKCGIQPN